jgi:hypothetical protein
MFETLVFGFPLLRPKLLFYILITSRYLSHFHCDAVLLICFLFDLMSTQLITLTRMHGGRYQLQSHCHHHQTKSKYNLLLKDSSQQQMIAARTRMAHISTTSTDAMDEWLAISLSSTMILSSQTIFEPFNHRHDMPGTIHRVYLFTLTSFLSPPPAPPRPSSARYCLLFFFYSLDAISILFLIYYIVYLSEPPAHLLL